jgi:PAS domain S-box-containing protein
MKLRSYLILLVVAAVLPVVIFAGVMTYASYQQRRETLAQGMIERARSISAALDREFLVSIQSLKVLAASTHLHKGQLAEFYLDMKGALAEYSRAWQNLTLVDSSGRQLINLRRPFGSPLPPTGNPEAIERIRGSKKAAIANLSPGPVTGALGIVVHVPVLKDGEVEYVLNAIFYAAPLTDLLLQQKLPSGWVATIIDRNQIVVARTRNVEKFFGKPASPSFAAQAKQYQESSWRGTTLDGIAVVAAHHRSDFSHWTVGLASPAEEVDASLWKSLLLTGAGGLLLLLAALGLAAILGERIAAPVSALSRAAEKLGRGETPEIPKSPIAEMSRLSQGIENAATLRIQAEDQLRYQLQLSQSITDKAADSIFVCDEQGRTTFVNPEATMTFGFSAEEFIGQPLHDKIHHHYPEGRPFPREECVLEQVHAVDQSVRNQEGVFFRKDGSAVMVECSNASMEVKGRRVGAILMVRNITERKAQEEIRRRSEDLEQQNLRMQETNRLKSEFLANMSHELRTPLNAVIGFSEVLIDEIAGAVNTTQRELLTDIWTSGKHLLHLVNDVLDLAKIEAGKLELHPETFSINTAIAETGAIIKVLALKKNIPIVMDIPQQEIVARLDPLRFNQILYNLLSNAVKFSPDHGVVTVTASLDGGERIKLQVRDTGIGIKKTDLPRLFHEFEQLDSGLARRQEGTGLGLALTKKIVELQNGSITVESEFGKGATFTVVLPINSGHNARNSDSYTLNQG